MAGKASSLINLGIAPQVAKIIGFEYGAYSAAGNSLATATQLTTKLAEVTGTDGTKGVKLPAMTIGEIAVVKDAQGTANLKVYPNDATIQFNGGSAGAAYSIGTAYAAGIFIQLTSTKIMALTTAVP